VKRGLSFSLLLTEKGAVLSSERDLNCEKGMVSMEMSVAKRDKIKRRVRRGDNTNVLVLILREEMLEVAAPTGEL
jgi:hypothetical protein